MKNNFFLLFLLIFILSCKEKPKHFSFVQMCDTQLGFGGYDHDLKSFKTAVSQINTLNPDFVVICGDLVEQANDSSYVDFKKIMAGFKMPCYVASGNHDIGNIPNNSTLDYYRNTIGKDYYKFQYKESSFIVTNTQLWKEDVGEESIRHDNWFKKTLKEEQQSGNKKIFVIGHYPLFLKTVNEKEEYFNLPKTKREELLQLFEQNGVVAYLSGHTHKTLINQYRNILFVSGETTSKNFDNNPFGFRLWNVGDSITQNFVALKPAVSNE
jgi:3',5'-cyclic AMP phosphodiesterase CpdA